MPFTVCPWNGKAVASGRGTSRAEEEVGVGREEETGVVQKATGGTLW